MKTVRLILMILSFLVGLFWLSEIRFTSRGNDVLLEKHEDLFIVKINADSLDMRTEEDSARAFDYFALYALGKTEIIFAKYAAISFTILFIVGLFANFSRKKEKKIE